MGISKFPSFDWSSLSEENLKPGSTSWNSTSKTVRQALENYSFFEVVLNKPSVEFTEELHSATKELFVLPQEIKEKNVTTKFAVFYYPSAGTKIPEAFGIADVTDIQACQNFTNLMWPQGNDRFCRSVHSYAGITLELEKLVTRMLCESYGLEEKCYEELVKATTSHLRLTKYQNTLMKGHTDKTFLTIIHQDKINGLQIRSKGGEWIPYVPSSPSSFLVMAGDLCMAWSNDRIKSAYHQVCAEGLRYSLIFITYLEGVLKAPDELVDEEHPLSYKPFDVDGLHNFYAVNIKNPNIREINVVKAYCEALN